VEWESEDLGGDVEGCARTLELEAESVIVIRERCFCWGVLSMNEILRSKSVSNDNIGG
jgi:hypothetical protein